MLRSSNTPPVWKPITPRWNRLEQRPIVVDTPLLRGRQAACRHGLAALLAVPMPPGTPAHATPRPIRINARVIYRDA
jgi:hypothetical protein